MVLEWIRERGASLEFRQAMRLYFFFAEMLGCWI
jgi:hypothetical protein